MFVWIDLARGIGIVLVVLLFLLSIFEIAWNGYKIKLKEHFSKTKKNKL